MCLFVIYHFCLLLSVYLLTNFVIVIPDHWVEFVKCLELFSNDSIGKDELLDLVSDLLINAAGNGTAGE